LTDSWLLQELVGKIESADADEARRRQFVRRTLGNQPPYVTILVRALDEGLKVMGRSGSEVIENVLAERFGLQKEDLAYKPGAYMSALKDILDTGCRALENVMLGEILKQTGIEAATMEDAAFKLKKRYEGKPS